MKSLKIFCAVILVTGIFLSSLSAEAKIVSDKLPLLTYAETSVSVYQNPNGKKIGSIPAASSLVMVKEIRADGWAYGSYKVLNSNRRRTGWFKFSAGSLKALMYQGIDGFWAPSK